MNIFFDVDYTILGVDDTLRPGTKEVFRRLTDDGHQIYIWSGNGIRWREVRMHGLEPFVHDCFLKPLGDYQRIMRALGIPVWPDLVIDDYPEVPTALGGIWIRPYLYSHDGDGDREMERVYDMIHSYVQTGRVDDDRFRLPGSPRPAL